MKSDYDELISNILNLQVWQYEETSCGFNRLLLSKVNNEVLIILYQDKTAYNAALRYIDQLKLNVKESINVPKYIFTNQLIERIENYLERGYVIVCVEEANKYLLTSECNDEYFERFMKIKANIVWFYPIYYRGRGHEIYDYLKDNTERFVDLFKLLKDDMSRLILREVLEVGVANRIYSLPQESQFKKYWECYQHIDNEVWVNCGSATGDTIIKYIYAGYKFDKIYAIEGDGMAYSNLQKLVNALPTTVAKKIVCINSYVGTEEGIRSLDDNFKDKRITLINMDIEGAEVTTLKGASSIIKKWRPVLAVCAYHRPSDLVIIPELITGIVDNYNFFIRKYIGYEPGALNEYIYYCVPSERLLYDEY